MKTLITFFFVGLTFFVFSQKLILDDQDTLICFTPEQSKFLLKEVTKLELLKKQDSINTLILAEQDSIIITQKSVIQTKNNIISTNNQLSDICEQQLSVKKNELQLTRKELVRQKRRKKASLISGSVIATILTTLLILK